MFGDWPVLEVEVEVEVTVRVDVADSFMVDNIVLMLQPPLRGLNVVEHGCKQCWLGLRASRNCGRQRTAKRKRGVRIK